MLSFRSMEESDLETVHLIEEQANAHPWTYQQFKDCLLNEDNPHHTYDCWLACLDNPQGENSIVGYGVLSTVLDETSLLNICVARVYQGQGFGRLLLEHLVEFIFAKKPASLFLEVRSSNQKARSLYESINFKKIAERKAYYPLEGGREDALIYCLNR